MRRKLSSEEKKARERMRLVEPKNAYKIVGHPRYWTRQFVDLYLERCDLLARHQPEQARLLAEQAPLLASRVRVGPAAESYADDARRRSAVALALIHRESLRHRLGDHDAAADDRREIEHLFARGVHKPVAAERWKRGALRQLDNDPAQVFRVLERALETLLEVTEQPVARDQLLAEVLLLRGLLVHRLLHQSSLVDFATALFLASAKTPSGRLVQQQALLALDIDLTRFHAPEAQRVASYRLVVRMKKRWSHEPKSCVKMCLFWAEGQLLQSFGLMRHAVRRMTKAHEGLLALGHGLELALLGLDLVPALRFEPGPERAREHVLSLRDTLQRPEIETPPELLPHLERWWRVPDLYGAALRALKLRCLPLRAAS